MENGYGDITVTDLSADDVKVETVPQANEYKSVVTLQVPDRVEVVNPSHSRSSSMSSTHSNHSTTMRSAKWFFRQREGRTNTNSTTRTRTTTGTSRGSNHPSETDSAKANRFQRKKSVMHGIMKRGRTMRKTVKGAMQINEADSGGSEKEGGRGYALTGEQKLRMYVLKEILETEEDYAKLLQFIVDVIIPSLQRLAKDEKIACVTSRTIPEMLSNIREIHRLHVRFSAALRDVMEPYPYYTNCIGNIFLKHRDEFKVYGEFCANFKTAQRISYELQADPTVLALIQDWKDSVASKTRKFLHLEGFIISPVQRLCKYPLLLRELKKFTPESHSDHTPVSNAMKMMEEVTASVNETERRAITMQAIRDVDNLFDNWEKSGVLSKQGFMTKQGGSVKTWNIRWFTLSGYEMKYYHEPTDVRPLGTLDLTSYKALEEDPSAQVGRPFSFGIKMPDRTYYMYTISEKEKKEWLTILNWKFSCIDRSRKQAHRPLETVIFSSLSSFLHPKERIEPQAQKNDAILALPGNELEKDHPLRKSRSKSLFKSFRSRRKQRASQSVSSHSHSQDG